MKLVERHVAKRQFEFGNHPFFSADKLAFQVPNGFAFAPEITFWVMTFQDILRVNATLTRDPQIRRIVRHHKAEDAGHQHWFLEDLAAMNVTEPDVRELFSKRHTPTRDAAYALMSEVYRAEDDRLRLVLIKVLESAGHIFFGRVASVVERAGWTKALKYFSFSHLEVEKNHQVFEDQMAAFVSSIRLTPAIRQQAKNLVDRCYAAFGGMFDAFCTQGARPVATRPANNVTPAVLRAIPAAARRAGRTPHVENPAVDIAATRATGARQVRARS